MSFRFAGFKPKDLNFGKAKLELKKELPKATKVSFYSKRNANAKTLGGWVTFGSASDCADAAQSVTQNAANSPLRIVRMGPHDSRRLFEDPPRPPPPPPKPNHYYSDWVYQEDIPRWEVNFKKF